MSKDSSALEVPEETQTNVTVSALSANTGTVFLLTACSLNPITNHRCTERTERCEGIRGGHWEHGHLTGHMETPPRHPGPIPRLPGILSACPWESTSSWVDSQVQWVVLSHPASATGVQTLPEMCHLWHSTLLPRTQQSPSLDPATLNDHVLLCGFSHTAPSLSS